MANCGSCGGNCAACSGCGRELELSRPEMDFLLTLGQIPFLPVARKMGDTQAVYLEDGPEKVETYTRVLACLEKKGLISLDYDKPLGRFDDSAYAAYPIRGIMALTQRGHQVLELLETQGFRE